MKWNYKHWSKKWASLFLLQITKTLWVYILPRILGWTRSCPENKVVCMLGIGSWATCILLDLKSEASSSGLLKESGEGRIELTIQDQVNTLSYQPPADQDSGLVPGAFWSAKTSPTTQTADSNKILVMAELPQAQLASLQPTTASPVVTQKTTFFDSTTEESVLPLKDQWQESTTGATTPGHPPRYSLVSSLQQTPERGGTHVSKCPLFNGGWGDTSLGHTNAHSLWCGKRGTNQVNAELLLMHWIFDTALSVEREEHPRNLLGHLASLKTKRLRRREGIKRYRMYLM